MNSIWIGVLGGIVGTFVMDFLNALCARTGIILPIDRRMIGRLAHGWLRGRFVYEQPGDVPSVRRELMYGYGAHYLIGIVLAVAYTVGWNALIGGTASPTWAVAYGVGTTGAAYFFLFPSIGLGVCAARSPRGIKLPLSSLVNHLFYGLGLGAALALL